MSDIVMLLVCVGIVFVVGSIYIVKGRNPNE
jgi:hypothetical protein